MKCSHKACNKKTWKKLWCCSKNVCDQHYGILNEIGCLKCDVSDKRYVCLGCIDLKRIMCEKCLDYFCEIHIKEHVKLCTYKLYGNQYDDKELKIIVQNVMYHSLMETKIYEGIDIFNEQNCKKYLKAAVEYFVYKRECENIVESLWNFFIPDVTSKHKTYDDMISLISEDVEEVLCRLFNHETIIMEHLKVDGMILINIIEKVVGAAKLSRGLIYTTRDTVNFFRENKKYGCLSNFAATPITYKDVVYPTSEHLYQCLKFMYDDAPEVNKIYAELIRTAKTPYQSKLLGNQRGDTSKKLEDEFQEKTKREQKVVAHPDWDQIKVGVMWKVLKIKFGSASSHTQMLIDTYPSYIVEKSPYDDFWGSGRNGDGKNMLGKLLMKIRLRVKLSL
ncbi:MAG TPA: NADAR family protein [Nitrosarchaeum sp.]|nr:NADAR family protein [Nitrosarchaeum sp.]